MVLTFLTFIKSVDEVKVKKEIEDNSDNENKTIDHLEIPVNVEVQDDSNLPDIGQAHNMFSRFLNLRIIKFSSFCFSTTQCPRTDLNKRSLSRPKTTTARKLIGLKSARIEILHGGFHYIDFSKTDFY